MRFYTITHKHYCGIDLHARKKYVCVLDSEGTVLVHREICCNPESFLRIVAPYTQPCSRVLKGGKNAAGKKDIQ